MDTLTKDRFKVVKAAPGYFILCDLQYNSVEYLGNGKNVLYDEHDNAIDPESENFAEDWTTHFNIDPVWTRKNCF